jgi:hypothetical protein
VKLWEEFVSDAGGSAGDDKSNVKSSDMPDKSNDITNGSALTFAQLKNATFKKFQAYKPQVDNEPTYASHQQNVSHQNQVHGAKKKPIKLVQKDSDKLKQAFATITATGEVVINESAARPDRKSGSSTAQSVLQTDGHNSGHRHSKPMVQKVSHSSEGGDSDFQTVTLSQPEEGVV